MKSILRALALTGILGMGAAAAPAQVRFAVRVGIPAPVVVAAVLPCPGVGYAWVPGYYAGAEWMPGAWVYRGYERTYVGGFYGSRDYGRGYAVQVRGNEHGYRGHEGFRGRR